MATTLPTLSRTIDNEFVHTWYEIRKEAIDNILDATVVMAALRAAGCFTKQVGGLFITRTLGYAEESASDVAKGDVLPQGETELETMGRWTWRYQASHAQRSIFDDQQNSGKFQIKSLVNTRLNAAREAHVQKQEDDVLAVWASTAESSSKAIQGLNEMIPTTSTANQEGTSNRVTGTYGKVNRPTAYSSDAASTGNTWWSPKYKAMTANPEVNLLSDMNNLYNSTANGKQPPNLIITDQTWFEIYEDFAVDASQIIKDESTHLADLGFTVLRYKGKPMVWTNNVRFGTLSNMLMLNTNFIEVVYDPNLWFDMTEWKTTPTQDYRIAHILCAMNIISSQLRRHGRLYQAA